MKYGLYYFKETKVLGDDIWAYAESLFYPHIDYYIDNTSIYKFRTENGENVATIMSAFIEPINHEWCFLPSSNVLPLFVGAYFRSTMWEYLDNKIVRDYIKAYEPIGVRSTSNVQKFLNYGIEAEFTGCVTLTLPEMEKKVDRYICCVDVPESVISYIRNEVGNQYEIKIISHEIWKWSEHEMIEYSNFSIDERFEKVKQLLQVYANAHCVVTSKLHCALPCLTQHTPVLLALPADGKGVTDMQERMSDFFSLFNLAYYDEFMSGKVKFDFINPPSNSNEYMKYREDIKSRINRFISDCENGIIESKMPYTEEKRKDELIDILEKKVMQLKHVVDNKNHEIYVLKQNSTNQTKKGAE
jgi:hypothetical protein